MQWFVSADGKQYGPYSSGALKKFALEGRLKPKSMVRRETDQNWFPAASVDRLFDAPAPSNASPVPRVQELPTPQERVAAQGDALDFLNDMATDGQTNQRSEPSDWLSEISPSGGVAAGKAVPATAVPAAQPVSTSLQCPHCQNRVLVDASLAGQTLACPHCSGLFAAPGQIPVRAASPSAPTADPMSGDFYDPATATRMPSRTTASLGSSGTVGLHKQRLGLAIVAGAGMLGTFLPWVHVPLLGSVLGTAGDGWITLCLFIPAMVLAFIGDKRQPVVAGPRLGAVIPAGFAAALGILKVAEFYKDMGDVPRDDPFARSLGASIQIGFGLYLIIIAGIAVVIVAWALALDDRGRRAQGSRLGARKY